MTAIKPSNLAAQLSYRGRGNPANAHPQSAISNCFPGLEFDFRTIWRRLFVGIELSEHNNYVVRADPGYERLIGHRLLLIDEPDAYPTGVATTGIVNPGFAPQPLASTGNPGGVSFMEWSNSMARIWDKQGKSVTCWFTPEESPQEVLAPADRSDLLQIELEVRWLFERSAVDGGATATLASALAGPGELSEGLCSPWQNDYRECACYYWAASRPDFVNSVDSPDGVTAGDQWLAKENRGLYIPDDRSDPRLWSYDDLFEAWQAHLRFVIAGSDAEDQRQRQPDG
jgi:hypothetical protein